MTRSTVLLAGWSFVLIVLLAACSDKDVSADADETNPSTSQAEPSVSSANESPSSDMKASSDRIQGTWRLVAFESGDETALNGSLSDIEVTAMFSADGTVSGQSGCNRYSAAVDVSDDELTVGAVAGTKMACPGTRMEIENAYTQALTLAKMYQIDGDTLTLLGEDDTLLLRFERSSDGSNGERGTSEASGSTGKVQFRATGNEPNWVLDVRKHTLHYSGPGGQFEQDEFIVPRADVKLDEGVPVLGGVGKGQMLDMKVEKRECTDSMSGETFAYTVMVKVNASTYNYEGCGREVGSGLDADWAKPLQSRVASE